MIPQAETMRGTLSDRERDVMDLVVQGKGNKEIGARLCISAETVKTHIGHIRAKTGIRNRVLLAVRWLEEPKP
jgi:DNA-binding CsgD family transcriptional regulator